MEFISTLRLVGEVLRWSGHVGAETLHLRVSKHKTKPNGTIVWWQMGTPACSVCCVGTALPAWRTWLNTRRRLTLTKCANTKSEHEQVSECVWETSSLYGTDLLECVTVHCSSTMFFLFHLRTYFFIQSPKKRPELTRLLFLINVCSRPPGL